MIEFILGLMIVLSFFFFYVKLSAVLVVGNYIHYATFMASRAYSSAAATKDEQTSNAEAVLNSMIVGRWKMLIKAQGRDRIPGATIGEGDLFTTTDNSWNQGVTFTFKPTTLTFYPSSKNNETLDFKLTSESWMAREESEDDTKTKKMAIMKKVQAVVPNIVVEWDNGNYN